MTAWMMHLHKETEFQETQIQQILVVIIQAHPMTQGQETAQTQNIAVKELGLLQIPVQLLALEWGGYGTLLEQNAAAMILERTGTVMQHLGAAVRAHKLHQAMMNFALATVTTGALMELTVHLALD